MKKWIYRAAGVGVFAVLLTWFWGLIVLPPATPSPQYSGPILSPASDRVLRASCFDCHSNETRYAWFDYLPVAAPLVAKDVMDGRGELNFSTWNQMAPLRVARKLKELREQVEEGEMPPWYYTLAHPGTALSPEVQRQLLADAAAAEAAAGAGEPSGSKDREHR